VEPALDSATRKAEQLADFLVGEVLDVSEHNDVTLLLIELFERLTHQTFRFASVNTGIGAWSLERDLTHRIIVVPTRSLEGFVAVRLAAHSVESAVLAVIDDDPVDPGRQLCVPSKASKCPEESQEHVLCDLFCNSIVVHPPETQGVNPVLVSAYDLGVGTLVSVFEALYEF